MCHSFNIVVTSVEDTVVSLWLYQSLQYYQSATSSFVQLKHLMHTFVLPLMSLKYHSIALCVHMKADPLGYKNVVVLKNL